MHLQSNHFTTPRGFVAGLAVFLLMIVLALLVWKTIAQVGIIPANHPSASALTSKVYTTNIISAIAVVALAGGVGAACFFVFRKSTQAASAGMCVILGLAAGAFGFQAYRYVTSGPQSSVALGGPSATSSTPSSNSSIMPSNPPLTPGQARSTVAQLADRLRSAGASAGTGEEPQRPAPAPTAPTAAPTRTAPVLPTQPPQATPTFDPQAEKIAQALAPLRSAIEDQTSETLKNFTSMLSELNTPPKQDIRVLREQADKLGQTRDQLATLAASIKALPAQAETALKAAGIYDVVTTGASMRFGIDLNLNIRAFGVDAAMKMIDHAKTEAELMRDNITKWKRGKDGKIESKDFQLKSSIDAARFFLAADLARKQQIIDQVAGR